MRPPKPICGVKGVSDPPQPRHQLSSSQTCAKLDPVAEFRRIMESIQPLPGTGGKLDALGLRRASVIKGKKKKYEAQAAQLPKKVHFANEQNKKYEAQAAQLPKKVHFANGQNKKYKAQAAQLSKKVHFANGDPECKKHYHQGSSSSASSQKMMDCGICMQSKPSFKFFSINGCKHSYCSSCLGSYIEAKVNMNVTLIKCPGPSCKDGKLEPLSCKLIVTKRVFNRWCDGLCESTVSVKFYCPFKDCSALLIDERDQEMILESECPHCHRLFCACCMVPWHSGLSCRRFLETKKLVREKRQDKMLMELAQKSKWQRCPKCKFYVEKTSGCMFIKCRCGSTFCYGCASEMDVDHYCQKCKR